MASGGTVCAVRWPTSSRRNSGRPKDATTTAIRLGAPPGRGRLCLHVARGPSKGGAERLPSDPFTHLYLFGGKVLVAWGEPRAITLPAGVEWYDARGRKLDAAAGPLMLDREDPLVAVSSAPLSAGDISLGPQPLLGDTFPQFDPRLAPDGSARGAGPDDGAPSVWTYLMKDGTGMIAPFVTMPGGEWRNEGWRPYIGHPARRPLTVTETKVNPVDFGQGAKPAASISVIERFRSLVDAAAVICGSWRVAKTSEDGISATISEDGHVLFSQAGTGPMEVRLEGIELHPGSTVDFTVGPNLGAKGGDMTERTIEIYDAAYAPATCPTRPTGY